MKSIGTKMTEGCLLEGILEAYKKFKKEENPRGMLLCSCRWSDDNPRQCVTQCPGRAKNYANEELIILAERKDQRIGNNSPREKVEKMKMKADSARDEVRGDRCSESPV